MKEFLNRYMATNRHLAKQSREELTGIFTSTSDTILKGIGAKAFRPQRAVNAAVVDSVMTGVAKRILVGGPIKSLGALKARFAKLMNDEVYRAGTETGTAQEANVKNRLDKAEAAFANVP
jgi:hypothetical protein